MRSGTRGDGRIADTGARGWWERDDRALPLDELIAMRDAGVPEATTCARATKRWQ